MFIAFLFFLRMFIRYYAQYLVLLVMKVPITRFEPLWYRFDLVYAAWNFQQQIAVVVVGALANTIIFCVAILIAKASKLVLNCFPKVFHVVICWLGIFGILDPYIVLFFDTVSVNHENGDMYKFPYHF